MSDYSIFPNAALTATADAIRTKLGSQTSIAFDYNTGFADAVDAISTDGGGGGVINVHTFYAIPATTAYTLSFEVGYFTMPDPYFCF